MTLEKILFHSFHVKKNLPRKTSKGYCDFFKDEFITPEDTQELWNNKPVNDNVLILI